jgi:hypothetical protein
VVVELKQDQAAAAVLAVAVHQAFPARQILEAAVAVEAHQEARAALAARASSSSEYPTPLAQYFLAALHTHRLHLADSISIR